MKLEGSLPCSQEPATDPYPESDKSKLWSSGFILQDED